MEKKQVEWYFCYWDDYVPEDKSTNNKLKSNEENKNYSNRKESSDKA